MVLYPAGSALTWRVRRGVPLISELHVSLNLLVFEEGKGNDKQNRVLRRTA